MSVQTEPVPDQNPDVTWAIEDIRGRLDHYNLMGHYYEGDHRLVFATEKFRSAFGDLFREFADNMCDDIVDEPVNRLTFQGWTAKDDAVAQAATDKWELCKGDARANSVHRDAWGKGDGFLLVWPDKNGVSRLYPQQPEQMAVRYDIDNPDEITVAAKVWRHGKGYRLNLYYDTRLERYATKGTTNAGGLPAPKNFEPFTETHADGTVQDWLEQHTYGQPVWHFPADEVGRYGRSVIKDCIPLQDALNKTVADMLVAMEFHALPQRWATGVQVEKDTEGNDISPFQTGGERVWWTAAEGASFGQFAQADLVGFLDVQDGFRLEIARKGALPAYMVNVRGVKGSAPSGISLLIADGRMVKRVKNGQRDWAPVWEGAMAQALLMDGHAVTDATDLDIEFGEASTRDDEALVKVLTSKVNDLGVTKHQAQVEMGYDPELIGEMEDDKAAATPAFGAVPEGGRMTGPGPGGMNALEAAMGKPGAPMMAGAMNGAGPAILGG